MPAHARVWFVSLLLLAVTPLSSQNAPAPASQGTGKPQGRSSNPASTAPGNNAASGQAAPATAGSTGPDSTAALDVAVDRNKLRAGQSYLLTLTVPDAQCKDASLSKQVGSVVAGSPHDLTVGTRPEVTGKPCLLAVNVTVPADAVAGALPLLLLSSTDTGGKVLGSVALTIDSATPLPASPIPAGLTPQVDMMWKVLPRQAVADNYGDRVADGFFAIEATFGNNTGYDIQVAALGFLPPRVDCNILVTKASPPDGSKYNTPYDYFFVQSPDGDQRPESPGADPW